MKDDAKERLTLFEATAIVVGIGVGGGVMATPFLASMSGVVPILIISGVAYLASILLHLMIAELTLRDGGDMQLVELLVKYVFTGRFGALITWVFFALLLAVFVFALAGYVVGCAEILHGLLGWDLRVGEIVSYLAAAGVVFFGLKAVGFVEKYAVIALAVIFASMSIGAVGKPIHPIPWFAGGAKETAALFGMIMFGFACFWSVPQAARGLSWNRRLIPWAVILGVGINWVFVLIVTFMSLLVSDKVTEVAVTGWGAAIGSWALFAGSASIFLAMITSYWATSLAFSVVLQERTGMNQKIAWLLATVPTLILALVGISGFLGFMRITGGAMAVMLAFLVVPGLRRVRKFGPVKNPVFALNKTGGTLFQVLVVVAYLLMAVGSMIPI